MEYRPFYFAREWVKAGHRVLVLAASFSHLRRVNPSVSDSFTSETHDGVDYLWVKTPAYQGNGPGRVLNMATFMYRLRMSGDRLVRLFAPDLVIASSTYTWDNWIGARWAKKFGALYVYEVHDLWPLSPIELGGMNPRNPFIWSLQRAEDFACRRADRVISLLPAAEEHLIAHGLRPDRFVYIPNGILREEWDAPDEAPPEHVRVLRDIRNTAPIVMGYVGGHGISNALDPLIEAGADARMKEITIVCVGDGPEKARLEEKARRLGSNVRFLPAVPKRSVPGLLRSFDVLYLGWTRSPLYRFGISPNKVFEYMMAGIPILHAVEAANDPVKDAGCGLSIAPESAPAICEGALSMMTLSAGQRREMGERGRRYVEVNHDLHVLAARFLGCLPGPGA